MIGLVVAAGYYTSLGVALWLGPRLYARAIALDTYMAEGRHAG